MISLITAKCQRNAGTEHYVRSYLYRTNIQYRAVEVEKDVLPRIYVITVIAVKRRLYPYVRLAVRQQPCDGLPVFRRIAVFTGIQAIQ